MLGKRGRGRFVFFGANFPFQAGIPALGEIEAIMNLAVKDLKLLGSENRSLG